MTRISTHFGGTGVQIHTGQKCVKWEIDKSKVGNFNIEGYFIWDLQKFVEEFILKQLQKRGLQIEDSTVSEE